MYQDQEQPDRRRDIPGWAQVFGSVFTTFLAAVTAANLASAAAAVLTAAAALAVCGAIMVGLNYRERSSRRRALVGVFVGVAIVLTLAAVIVASLARSRGPVAAQGSADGESAPIMSAENYRLAPSSSVFTNDQDKVDLDTGCPGHGPTRPQLGPARCGENADLILDSGELLTWERMPRIALLPADRPASHTTCRQSAAEGNLAGSIEVNRLEAGSGLCVLTDKGNIAAVRIESLAELPTIVISFDVWSRG